MKWNALALVLVLFGCSSQAVPTLADNPAAWQSYGEERAKGGYIVQSESKLDAFSTTGQVSQAQYQAYLAGYESGKAAYCSLAPSYLATKGEIYRGICDDVDPFFRAKFSKAI
ncbi:hypothetical protein BIY21_12590 [Vibrio ponticus]|uniref:DUF2799 domain-containing protein n=1 Tax=Vibrio ponticus TaxID=265668 RepID=A0A3N3DXD6_9VIBR|nr:DUF2799 domain-containing protein [Vibrio ponticus]OLQ92063.1 hypothetical protein BIY21_12590 [Vibrio ponticus]ROV59181.1 DUF2799 domain-containing protein [Vibrio ponticus]